MKVIIKKLGVMSVAKFQAVLAAIVGLIIGIIFALFGTIGKLLSGSSAVGSGLGILGIIVFPILYAICGFVGGIIGAWLFNLVAQWVGGVEVEMVEQQ